MRTLFVGEAPNRAGESGGLAVFLTARAMGQGAAYRRDPSGWMRALARNRKLRKLAFWLARSPQVNLIGHWIEEWPAREARIGAQELADEFRNRGRFGGKDLDFRFDSVVVVGRRVAHAMELRTELFRPTEWSGRPAVVLPHPSGRSFYWNEGEPARFRVLAELMVLSGMVPREELPSTRRLDP